MAWAEAKISTRRDTNFFPRDQAGLRTATLCGGKYGSAMSSTPKPVLCGTPGCTLKKGHLGLCSSNALVDASPASRRAAVAARQAERERGSERAAFQSPTAAKAPPKIHLRLSGTGEWRSEALAADT